MNNQINVELLSAHSGLDLNLDLAIVKSARISFLKEDEIRKYETDMKLLRYLWEHEHLTPFEQITYQFKITAPVVVWWHMVN